MQSTKSEISDVRNGVPGRHRIGGSGQTGSEVGSTDGSVRQRGRQPRAAGQAVIDWIVLVIFPVSAARLVTRLRHPSGREQSDWTRKRIRGVRLRCLLLTFPLLPSRLILIIYGNRDLLARLVGWCVRVLCVSVCVCAGLLMPVNVELCAEIFLIAVGSQGF